MGLSISDAATVLDSALNSIKLLLALMGGLVIFLGALRSIINFAIDYFGRRPLSLDEIDTIRLKFGRHIILGLEFIVAADVIETTTTPDYYSIGILAILVALRSFLSYFLGREIAALNKEPIKKAGEL